MARILQKATLANLTMGIEGTDKGWKVKSGRFVVNWFQGEQDLNEEELICEDEVEEERDGVNSSDGECDVEDSD